MIKEAEQKLLYHFAEVSYLTNSQESFLEEFDRDALGNFHFTLGNGSKKIQVIFQVSPFGVMVGNDGKEGKEAVFLNEKTKKPSEEEILYHGCEAAGILRKGKEEQWYFEDFTSNKTKTGVILDKKNNIICKDYKLYGYNLSDVLALYFAYNLKENFDIDDKSLCFTVWNSTVSGESGLISSLSYANADEVFLISSAHAKDFVEDAEPALVLKDGNYVLPMEERKYFRDTLSAAGQSCGGFVGKTSTAMERLSVHASGKLFGLYLPVQHFQSNVEEIFWKDVEKTRDILLKYMASV